MVHSRLMLLMLLAMLFAGRAHAASSGNLAVSAYITSWGYCWVSGTQSIVFGSLDPLAPQNVQATGRIDVTCIGVSGNFTVGVTQVTSSPLILEKGSDSIPYTLDLPTSAGNNVFFFGSVNIPVTAHIKGSDYRYAPAGTYTDTVVLEINP